LGTITIKPIRRLPKSIKSSYLKNFCRQLMERISFRKFALLIMEINSEDTIWKRMNCYIRWVWIFWTRYNRKRKKRSTYSKLLKLLTKRKNGFFSAIAKSKIFKKHRTKERTVVAHSSSWITTKRQAKKWVFDMLVLCSCQKSSQT
jgi:hypothetical protein